MAARSFEADLLKKIEECGFSPQPQKKSSTLLAYIPRFQSWVDESHLLKAASKRYYRDGIAVLSRSSLAYVPLGAIKADVVDTTTLHELSGAETSPHLSNSALATLRRLLNKAKLWADLRDAPQVKLRAAQGRTALITGEIEDKLLAQLQKPETHPCLRADRETLVDIYLMMHDAGMLTSEAASARVELIDWEGKRLFNPGGKSKKAKRWIPLSDRLVSRLRVRCQGRAKGCVFPSTRGSRSRHLVSPQKGFRQDYRDAGISDDILL